MNLAPNCPIDLDTLMQTRMLIVAGSGGGKSYALRKLIEETAPEVQQLIIDPEGEYASLREKHDYVLVAAKDGDVPASPKTAAVLARRLLELGVSAILDLYELPVHDRQWFVKHFLDALVNAPKELWKQVMVVLDEAHVYCPQNGSAEAMQSVIDVASRGRKRGLCLVLASQRISKLHKDTAAEMQNKLIGLTNLDVDRKRAAEELGMTIKEAVPALRLDRGEFYAFGPALVKEVTKIKVGKVKTSHASGAGKFAAAPPAPSANVKKQLVKLADLAVVAAKEAATMQELKDEVARLKREAKKPAMSDDDVQRLIETSSRSDRKAYETAIAALHKEVRASYDLALKLSTKLESFAITPIEFNAFPIVTQKADPSTKWLKASRHPMLPPDDPQPGEHVIVGVRKPRFDNGDFGIIQQDVQLKAGARRMLQELAARYPIGWTRRQLGALANISYKSGTFSTYLGILKKEGYVEEISDELRATNAGMNVFPDQPAATTHAEAMAQWGRTLKAGARRMLDVIVEAGEHGIHRANVADAANLVAGSGTFSTYLGTLKGRGLVDERGKKLYANDVLFP